jgi:hypothetical protein
LELQERVIYIILLLLFDGGCWVEVLTNLPNKTGVFMALYYDLTMRGTIGSLNWAVRTHWRLSDGLGVLSEAQICEALCEMGYIMWDDLGKEIVTSTVVLTKLLAVAYDEPTGFFELPASIIGQRTGDINPPFTAKGIRQFRSNSDFRTSTHRLPEVREDNNSSGSWVFDVQVTTELLFPVAEWFGEPHVVTVPDTILEVTFIPVLIRTQFTTEDPVTHVKTVTYLTPHEISDVAGSSFYGITSQVSRKFIMPT